MSALTGSEFYPVVVVGAGPTGLTIANLLGRYGVPTLVVDRKATTVQEARAVSIDDEALRTLQAAGLVERVLPTIVPGYGSEYYTARGRCFLKFAPQGQPYGYPRRNAFRQPVLEDQLLDGLRRFDHCRAMFSTQLLRFDQDADAVSVTLRCADGSERTVRCAYLVGADGASSTVREQLGIPLTGETFAERWLIVDLEDSPCDSRETIVYCDARRPAIALPGPALSRRFEFKLHADETPEQMLNPTRVDELLQQFGAAKTSRIARTVVYTFHARVAKRWQVGRVFLAGDACHLTPPFAGQGMNSGIRDAHNIAWKLAAAHTGLLGPGVLETYELERPQHVREMIRLALRLGRLMAPSDNYLGASRQFLLRLLRNFPSARDYFAEMRFKPAPKFLSGFFWKAGRASGVSEIVGTLLPQPQVIDASGAVTALDEHLGDGFALLGLNMEPSQLAPCIRLAAFQMLRVKAIAVSNAPTDAHGVVGICDPSGVLPALVSPREPTVLLVRPDRYVAGGFRLDNADAFSRETMDRLRAFGPKDVGNAQQWAGPAGVRGDGPVMTRVDS